MRRHGGGDGEPRGSKARCVAASTALRKPRHVGLHAPVVHVLVLLQLRPPQQAQEEQCAAELLLFAQSVLTWPTRVGTPPSAPASRTPCSRRTAPPRAHHREHGGGPELLCWVRIHVTGAQPQARPNKTRDGDATGTYRQGVSCTAHQSLSGGDTVKAQEEEDKGVGAAAAAVGPSHESSSLHGRQDTAPRLRVQRHDTGATDTSTHQGAQRLSRVGCTRLVYRAQQGVKTTNR